jgi:DNA-binding NarL/FixJ family response regulator
MASVAEISHSIRSLLARKTGVDDLPLTTSLVSGRRRYLVRVFALECESRGRSAPTIAITVERSNVLGDLAVRFQLTGREVEVVRHLVGGLTSKEIAARMNVSPNTVKAFFRLVMTKMGVTTRAGVIGKLVAGELSGSRG